MNRRSLRDRRVRRGVPERSLEPVTTIEAAHPRVEWMLDHGYGFEKIEDEIEALEGLDSEEQSALWVWAWTITDMGCADRRPRRGGPHDH
jgi:hypothetical protein